MTTILLIEPDTTLGATYARALEQAGHKVVVRQTADSAIAAMDQNTIDLVVLELNIALHNGVEFLYEMRSYPEWENIGVILHTNVREKQINEAARKRLGIIAFLYKPKTTLVQLQEAVALHKSSALQPVA